MNNLHKKKTVVIAIYLTVVCAVNAANNIVATRFQPGPVHTGIDTLKVFKTGESTPPDFEVLGVVNGFGMLNKKMMTQIQVAAREMGADALVGYDSEVFDFPFVTALAVKLLPSGSGKRIQRPDLLVAIPPANFTLVGTGEKKSRKFENAARHYSRYFLAQRGYYAFYSDDELQDLKNSKNDKKTVLNTLESEMADSALNAHFMDRKSASIVIATGTEVLLHVSIYSKSKGKIVWSNAAKGAAATGMLLNAVMPSIKNDLAVRESIKTSISSLTFVFTYATTPASNSDKAPPAISEE